MTEDIKKKLGELVDTFYLAPEEGVDDLALKAFELGVLCGKEQANKAHGDQYWGR